MIFQKVEKNGNLKRCDRNISDIEDFPFVKLNFKGSLDPSHSTCISEINVGKRRIRHTTTMKLNVGLQDRLRID